MPTSKTLEYLIKAADDLNNNANGRQSLEITLRLIQKITKVVSADVATAAIMGVITKCQQKLREVRTIKMHYKYTVLHLVSIIIVCCNKWHLS